MEDMITALPLLFRISSSMTSKMANGRKFNKKVIFQDQGILTQLSYIKIKCTSMEECTNSCIIQTNFMSSTSPTTLGPLCKLKTLQLP